MNDKIRTLEQLYSILPQDQLIMTDVLRQIVTENLPAYCKEKLSFQVPYFYGKKGMVIIWPAAIPRGGIKAGVLLGFWQGRLLMDRNKYLKSGPCVKLRYKVFSHVDEIREQEIKILLKEAVELDKRF